MTNWCDRGCQPNITMTSGFKNFPGHIFLIQETQKWHWDCPKTSWYLATGKILSIMHGKYAVYICEKKICVTIAE